MGRRKPAGVLTLDLPNWFGSRSQGFHIVCNAAVGQNSYVGVFNQSKDSSFYVYATDIAITGNVSYCFYESIFGNPGTTFNEAPVVTNAPIDPREPSLGLTPIFFTSPVCVGFHCGGRSAPTNSAPSGSWAASPYPLIIAPPGYSALIQVRNQNLTIEATIFGTMVKDG